MMSTTMVWCGTETTVLFVKHPTKKGHTSVESGTVASEAKLNSLICCRQLWQFIVHYHVNLSLSSDPMHFPLFAGSFALLDADLTNFSLFGHLFPPPFWLFSQRSLVMPGLYSSNTRDVFPVLMLTLRRATHQNRLHNIWQRQTSVNPKIYAGKLNVPKCQWSFAILIFKSRQFAFYSSLYVSAQRFPFDAYRTFLKLFASFVGFYAFPIDQVRCGKSPKSLNIFVHFNIIPLVRAKSWKSGCRTNQRTSRAKVVISLYLYFR